MFILVLLRPRLNFMCRGALKMSPSPRRNDDYCHRHFSWTLSNTFNFNRCDVRKLLVEPVAKCVVAIGNHMKAARLFTLTSFRSNKFRVENGSIWQSVTKSLIHIYSRLPSHTNYVFAFGGILADPTSLGPPHTKRFAESWACDTQSAVIYAHSQEAEIIRQTMCRQQPYWTKANRQTPRLAPEACFLCHTINVSPIAEISASNVRYANA